MRLMKNWLLSGLEHHNESLIEHWIEAKPLPWRLRLAFTWRVKVLLFLGWWDGVMSCKLPNDLVKYGQGRDE